MPIDARFRLIVQLILFYTLVMLGSLLAVFASGCADEPATPPVAAPPAYRVEDTTGQSYIWTMDTLGPMFSLIRGVFVLNDSIAWAVGEFDDVRDDGTPDPLHPYGLACWRGGKWTRERHLSPLGADYEVYTGYTAVFAFSPDDLWVANWCAKHWDGKRWTTYLFPDTQYDGVISSIYGDPRTGAVYFGGFLNKLFKFQHGRFTRLQYPKMTDFDDLCSDGYYVYAIAIRDMESHVIRIDPSGSVTDVERTDWTAALWAGQGKLLRSDGHEVHWGWPDKSILVATRTYSFSHVAGTRWNDLYMVGSGGETWHYNGDGTHMIRSADRDGPVYVLDAAAGGRSIFLTVYPGAQYPVVLRGRRL